MLKQKERNPVGVDWRSPITQVGGKKRRQPWALSGNALFGVVGPGFKPGQVHPYFCFYADR
jgi:hypothetical protein